MKLFVLISFVAFSIGSPQDIKISDKLRPTITKSIEKVASESYASSQKQNIEVIDRLLLRATSCRWKFAKVFSDNGCKKQDSAYCGFMGSLKDSARKGVKDLEKQLDEREEIGSKAIGAYVDEVTDIILSKLDEFVGHFEPSQLICYLTQSKQASEKYKNEIQAHKQAFLNETQTSFEDEMNTYREEIDCYNKLIVTQYKRCLADEDKGKCLEDYVKGNDVKDTPFRFKVLHENILESVREQLAVVGPDASGIEKVYNEHHADIVEAFEKCR